MIHVSTRNKNNSQKLNATLGFQKEAKHGVPHNSTWLTGKVPLCHNTEKRILAFKEYLFLERNYSHSTVSFASFITLTHALLANMMEWQMQSMITEI